MILWDLAVTPVVRSDAGKRFEGYGNLNLKETEYSGTLNRD